MTTELVDGGVAAQLRVAAAKAAKVALIDVFTEQFKAVSTSLRIELEAVSRAREFAADELYSALREQVECDRDHIDNVVLVVSELVTNAVKYGALPHGEPPGRNIWLELGLWPKWTLVTVDDRDREVHKPVLTNADDDLPESGRGLFIVQTLAARFWWRPRRMSKTANAVVLRTRVELDEDDFNILDRLEATDE